MENRCKIHIEWRHPWGYKCANWRPSTFSPFWTSLFFRLRGSSHCFPQISFKLQYFASLGGLHGGNTAYCTTILIPYSLLFTQLIKSKWAPSSACLVTHSDLGRSSYSCTCDRCFYNLSQSGVSHVFVWCWKFRWSQV